MQDRSATWLDEHLDVVSGWRAEADRVIVDDRAVDELDALTAPPNGLAPGDPTADDVVSVVDDDGTWLATASVAESEPVTDVERIVVTAADVTDATVAALDGLEPAFAGAAAPGAALQPDDVASEPGGIVDPFDVHLAETDVESDDSGDAAGNSVPELDPDAVDDEVGVVADDVVGNAAHRSGRPAGDPERGPAESAATDRHDPADPTSAPAESRLDAFGAFDDPAPVQPFEAVDDLTDAQSGSLPDDPGLDLDIGLE